MLAGEAFTVHEHNEERLLAAIKKEAAARGVTHVVMGYPKNMNNSEGDRAKLSLEFKEKLERRTGLPVLMWDERLTTVAADKAMMEAGIRRENRKEYVDMIAATFILQGYLDLRANSQN